MFSTISGLLPPIKTELASEYDQRSKHGARICAILYHNSWICLQYQKDALTFHKTHTCYLPQCQI